MLDFPVIEQPRGMLQSWTGKSKKWPFCFYLSNPVMLHPTAVWYASARGSYCFTLVALLFCLFSFPQLDGASVKIAHPSATINTNSKRALITDFQCKL